MSEQAKKCRVCGELKPFTEFAKRKYSTTGCRSECKACAAKKNRKHYEDSPEKEKARKRKSYEDNPEKYKEWGGKWRERCPERTMFLAAKNRADKAWVPFDIESTDIVVPAICPVLGIPIFKGVGVVGPNSPSLDRVEPHKGYTKGNVMVMSHKANSMKQNATLEELVLIGEWARGMLEREAIVA